MDSLGSEKLVSHDGLTIDEATQILSAIKCLHKKPGSYFNSEIFTVPFRSELAIVKKVTDFLHATAETQVFEILSSQPHPNIISPLGIIKTNSTTYFVLPLLFEISDEAFMGTLAQNRMEVVAALQHLEALGIRHNDLNFNNFLLSKDQKIQLIDFGLAQHRKDFKNTSRWDSWVKRDIDEWTHFSES